MEERVLGSAASAASSTIKDAAQASAASKVTNSIGNAFAAHPIGNLFNVGFSLWDYNSYREKGKGRLESGLKAAGTFAAGEMIGIKYIPIMLGVAGAQAMVSGGEMTGQVASSNYKRKGAIGDGNFSMSQAGYTMRQRGMNAMQKNGMNVNSVLGNEARTFFRTSGYN